MHFGVWIPNSESVIAFSARLGHPFGIQDYGVHGGHTTYTAQYIFAVIAVSSAVTAVLLY